MFLALTHGQNTAIPCVDTGHVPRFSDAGVEYQHRLEEENKDCTYLIGLLEVRSRFTGVLLCFYPSRTQAASTICLEYVVKAIRRLSNPSRLANHVVYIIRTVVYTTRAIR